MNKSQKVILCVVLFIVLLIAWGLFPLLFKWLMIGLGTEKTALEDFGTFGDIYGSLNTLFTSATLIIVMYSAYLQRQANQDAREAMEKHLQQAREDTEKQLRQAHEATEQQISNAKKLADIQLEHAKSSIREQLNLARQTHSAQINETKLAFFTSQFYALLNYKNEKLKELVLFDEKGNELKGHILFKSFFEILIVKMLNKIDELGIDKFDSNEIRSIFNQTGKELNKGQTYYELFAYFETYASLIELIDSAAINTKDKKFFWSVIRRSMNANEQRCVFLLAPMWERLYIHIRKMSMFNTFEPNEYYTEYGLKFYTKHNFYSKSWSDFFNSQNKTPT